MEIKYEPVFGPQELFDGAPDDAEMAYETANHVRGYYKKCNSLKFFSNGKWVRVLNEKAMIIHAMRRIIKVPTWTKADQLAGKLPEVGAKVIRVDHEDEGCNVIGDCPSSVIDAVKLMFDNGVTLWHNGTFNYGTLSNPIITS